MLAFNWSRIFSGEIGEATDKVHGELVQKHIAETGSEPDEATNENLKAQAREQVVFPVMAIATATAPIETVAEATLIFRAMDIAPKGRGIKGVLSEAAALLGAGVREGTSEGFESAVGSGIKKMTYAKDMTFDDAMSDLALNVIGGAAAGGTFHSGFRALNSFAKQPAEFYQKPISEERHKALQNTLEAQAERLATAGSPEQAERLLEASRAIAEAKTNGDALKVIMPGAAFGKVGIKAEEAIAAAQALGERLQSDEVMALAQTYRTELDEMVAERRRLIDELNAQADEAADIEDLDEAKAQSAKVKAAKRQLEKSFEQRIQDLIERAESDMTPKVRDAADNAADNAYEEAMMAPAMTSEERANAILSALGGLDVSSLPQREQVYINMRLGEIENRMATHAQLVADLASLVREGRKASKHVMRVADTKKGRKRFSRSIDSALAAEEGIAVVSQSIDETSA
jgi:hypothetical protein